jgi:hypothetical protein
VAVDTGSIPDGRGVTADSSAAAGVDRSRWLLCMWVSTGTVLLAAIVVAVGVAGVAVLAIADETSPDAMQVAGRVVVAAVYTVACGHAIKALRLRRTDRFGRATAVAGLAFGFATIISIMSVWLW